MTALKRVGAALAAPLVAVVAAMLITSGSCSRSASPRPVTSGSARPTCHPGILLAQGARGGVAGEPLTAARGAVRDSGRPRWV